MSVIGKVVVAPDCEQFMNLIDINKAKDHVKQNLKNYHWVRGVGISKDSNNNYIIVVNVSEMTEDILNMIPSRCGSFGVCVKSVGNIKAL